jgi:cytidylate kinase
MVGRDIGSVVLPEAGLRIYLDASVEIRAQRRYEEQIDSEDKLSLNEVKVDLERRDLIDTQRQDSPLSKYDFYTIIDTTKMSLEDVVNEITSIYRSQF